MQWRIPGTVLEISRQEADRVHERFSAMFMAGGIALGQVCSITGLEPYTVQNWVKRGFLSPPQQKRYSLRQLCRIIIINMLKGVLPMERICGLLTYINGQLDDESDDMIDDSWLYFMFLRLAVRAKELDRAQQQETILEEVMAGYEEPIPGAKKQVQQVLRIMLLAYLAARMQREAEKQLAEIESKEDNNERKRNISLEA